LQKPRASAQTPRLPPYKGYVAAFYFTPLQLTIKLTSLRSPPRRHAPAAQPKREAAQKTI